MPVAHDDNLLTMLYHAFLIISEFNKFRSDPAGKRASHARGLVECKNLCLLNAQTFDSRKLNWKIFNEFWNVII